MSYELRVTNYELRITSYELRVMGAWMGKSGFDREGFKTRTKQFALRVLRLTQALPKTTEAEVIGRQLLRAGTSVGANYRAACRAKSPADHINKLKIVEEEADETLYWLELLVEAELMPLALLSELMKEGDEIVAIVVASLKTQRSQSAKTTRNS